MSHSVFRDLDSDKNSGNSSTSDIADKNLIIFINKDGEVQVDPNALQDLVVNATTQTKSTVSVIRVGSPTPSMEAERNKESDESDSEDNNDEEKNDDDDDDDEEKEDGSNSSNSDKSDASSESGDSQTTNKAKRNKRKKKKKNKVPGVSLTVEEFFDPEQAVKLAAEILSIAGIKNPKQMKADYDRLRYIIQNDHCYTPFTPADVDSDKTADENPEPASRDNKPKPLVKLAGASTSNASKKLGRNVQANGVDKEGAENSRTKSTDEANSSVENNGDSEDDEDEETDFSDFTPSESDNDRDSDLDFSVYDSHSRRTKKVKKRKLKSAKKALQQSKKRRHSTVESTLSDDASTQSRKKLQKVPKKNTSATSKSSSTVTPTTSNTLKSPVASSTPRLSKGPTSASNTKETPPTTTTPKSVPQTSAAAELPQTPIIKKVTQAVNPKGATPKEPIQPSNPTGANNPSLPKELPQRPKVIAEPTNPAIVTTTRTMTTGSAGIQKGMIVVRNTVKEAPKPVPVNEKAASNVPMLLPTLDKAKKTIYVPIVMNRDRAQGSSVTLVTNPKIQKTFLPLSSSPSVSSAPIITYVNRAMIRTTNPSTKQLMEQTLSLQSEQDKQLDLINSLVQEELNKSESHSSMSSASVSCNADVTMPAAIPNIVKMLQTSELPSECRTNDLLGLGNDSLASHVFDPSNETELPDDLLDGIDDPEELSDDLMRLVEDDKALRDVIDQEVLNRSTAGMVSNTILTNQLMPISSPVVNEQPIILNTVNPILSGLSANSPIQLVAKIITTSANTTPTTSREPIKVKRSDGRIIVLPPIEAPATRGAKRRAETIVTPETQQKAKIVSTTADTPIKLPTESPLKKDLFRTTPKAKPVPVQDRRASVASKNSPQGSKVKRSLSISNPPQFDDLDDENDESDYSYNSEDDPHRLWCICQTPHNNRFMICCDKCLEWFHGKCVGITKSMGKDIEQRGSEWICPKCKEKQQPSIKNIFSRQLSANAATNIKEQGAGSPNAATQQTMPDSSPTSRINCSVCGVKPTRNNTSYCGDDCARKYAQQTKTNVTIPVDATTSHQSDTLLANTKQTIKMVATDSDRTQNKPTQAKLAQPVFRDKANHVVVYEKGTDKFLTGKSAPLIDKLDHWLKLHPNYEVLKPGTQQAIAFRAKQMQLKSLARELQAKELFAVNQPPKVQTTLRIEPDKKIVFQNPLQKGQLKKAIVVASGVSPTTPKSNSLFVKPDAIAKNPKLTATPQQKSSATPPAAKRRSEDLKSPNQTKSSTPTSASKTNERNQLRSNARKTMITEITTRTKEITDPNVNRLTDDEIARFVTAVEAEMFAMFGNDTNMKYKSKYRSLLFNIKDRKNKTLFEKITNKIIDPKKLVRLSAEELASQELAKWREMENKHQLDMITKSELDMLALGKTYVLKTHKGEEVIQESGSNIDSTLAVKDVVSALSQSAVSSSSEVGDEASTSHTTKDRHDKSSSSSKRDSDRSRKDRHESSSKSSSSISKHKRKRSRDRHHSSRDRSRDTKREKRDGERERDRDKERDKSKSHSSDSRKDKKDYKSGSSSSGSSKSSKHSGKDSKNQELPAKTSVDKSKIDENSIIDKILKAQSTIDSILHPNESKKSAEIKARAVSAANESDQEPSSTVTIPTPPERTPEIRSLTPPISVKPLYTGNISLIDVVTIKMSISYISGDLSQITFPKRDTDICGRIAFDSVWQYLSDLRATSKEIVLVQFSMVNEDDRSAYLELLEHLYSRKRMGVIKDHCAVVKDCYVLPLPPGQPTPQKFIGLTGRDFGTNHRGMLVGLIIRHKTISKIIARQSNPAASHKSVAHYSAKDTRYTPPASPNLLPITSKKVHKPLPINLDDDEPYSPGGSDDDDSMNSAALPFLSTSGTGIDYTKITSNAATFATDNAIQRKVEELNRQIAAEKKQIAMHLQAVDIDEPYSPTSSVSPPINANLSDVVSNISIPPNLADILKNIPTVPMANIATTSSIGQMSNQMPLNPYTLSTIDASEEYVPTASSITPMTYTSSVPMQITKPADEPSKLAQLTEEELMRLVPDNF